MSAAAGAARAAEATPLAPFPVERPVRATSEALVALLRGLDADAWDRPANRAWTVRDVAAHLLDGQLRRLSFERDGLPLLAPPRPLDSFAAVVEFLDGLNAGWVEVARRLSPRVVTDLLELSGRWVAELCAATPLDAPAQFFVDWARGADGADRAWLDLARDLTEHWHHQQQIRVAAGVPLLATPEIARPVFAAYLHALVRACEGVERAEGSALAVTIAAPLDAAWTWSLVRRGGRWVLCEGAVADATARVACDVESAWRSLTNALPAERRAAVRIGGDRELAERFFAATAMMVG